MPINPPRPRRLVKYITDTAPRAEAAIQFNLLASHKEGSGKSKKTVYTHNETRRIPCGQACVSEVRDNSEAGKDWLMRVGMSPGSLFSFSCRYTYTFETKEQKKFIDKLMSEYRSANEWRDSKVECTQMLYFSEMVEPTLVDKGGGSPLMKSLVTWDVFMLCNLLFLSAPFIFFYHFASVRAVYHVRKVFTVSLDKSSYPSWVTAGRGEN
mmetsp:Transcript_87176/g.247483  ORF Transcript_87176/g.247483 Transcript_87176/m.247483 type:complete len:210 (-) Transcript_87176:309-938(-)